MSETFEKLWVQIENNFGCSRGFFFHILVPKQLMLEIRFHSGKINLFKATG